MDDQRLDAAPLTGLRVVDFSHFIAGPICTMQLGDMGAEVIKIENSAAGDDLRRFPPLLEGQSSAFLWTNRNKLGIALDLKQPQAVEIAKDLIASADILVENFSSGVMERFGLDYDASLQDQPAADLLQHLGLRPRGRTRIPRRLRPDDPGGNRLHVDERISRRARNCAQGRR